MRTACRLTLSTPLIVTLLLLSAACGAPAPLTGPAPPPTEACRLVTGDPEAGPVVRVGLAGSVSSNTAPVARNAEESFVFAHLYEGLIELDCEGRVMPALAHTWSRLEGGHRWVFEIQPDARFWTGEPVTTRDIVASWRAVQPRSALPDGVRAIELLDRERLAISLERPTDEPPSFLAHPSFAVARRDSTAVWPVIGSGPYQVVPPTSVRSGQPSSSTTFLRLLRAGLPETTTEARRPSGGGLVEWPSITEIQISSGGDGRDLLDQGVDLLVTRELETLQYGSALPDLRSIPLPWDRTYVLHVPGDVGGRPSDARAGRDPSFFEALARDAVREEARPAEAPFAWREDAGCATLESAERSRFESAERFSDEGRRVAGIVRVGYPGQDPTARALAERLVALAATDGAGFLGLMAARVGSGMGFGAPVAVGLSPDRFQEALRDGTLEGFVFGVSRGLGSSCASLDGWSPSFISVLSRVDRAALLALVDTRARVLTRSPSPAIRVGGNRQPLLTTTRPGGFGR